MVSVATPRTTRGTFAPTRKTPSKDLSKWLDRNQASDLLGVSVSHLQNLEKRHKLSPSKDWRRADNGAERWVWVYDPHELAKIPVRDRSQLRSPGELAARAFEMFDEAASVRQVVIALRELPQTVEELKMQYDNHGGSDRVINPSAWDALTVLVGPFKSVAELIERVEQKLATTKTDAAERRAEERYDAACDRDARAVASGPPEE